MEDYMIRTLAYNRQVRILFVENTAVIRTICAQSGVRGRLRRTALGTTLSVASLLSGILKDQQRISLKVTASRPGCRIFADVDAYGNLRGYLSDEWRSLSDEGLKRLSLAEFMGTKGYVQVIKDLGLHQTFTGITAMVRGNIVDDLSHYFNQSEQTPTCFVNHLEFDEMDEPVASRGVMAQLLPGASADLLREIQGLLQHQSIWKTHRAVSELPALLFHDCEIMSVEPIQASCGCCRELFYPMLAALGPVELREAVRQGREMEIACHICGASYSFAPDEIARLLG